MYSTWCQSHTVIPWISTLTSKQSHFSNYLLIYSLPCYLIKATKESIKKEANDWNLKETDLCTYFKSKLSWLNEWFFEERLFFFLFYCSGFCHTLKWISHEFTCVPHPDPPSHLPLHPIPLGLPSAQGPRACLMHPTWAGDLFHPR